MTHPPSTPRLCEPHLSDTGTDPVEDVTIAQSGARPCARVQSAEDSGHASKNPGRRRACQSSSRETPPASTRSQPQRCRPATTSDKNLRLPGHSPRGAGPPLGPARGPAPAPRPVSRSGQITVGRLACRERASLAPWCLCGGAARAPRLNVEAPRATRRAGAERGEGRLLGTRSEQDAAARQPQLSRGAQRSSAVPLWGTQPFLRLG